MKTEKSKSVVYCCIALIILIPFWAKGQTVTGTDDDFYVVNKNNNNITSALRLQTGPNYGWSLINNQNILSFNYTNTTNFSLSGNIADQKVRFDNNGNILAYGKIQAYGDILANNIYPQGKLWFPNSLVNRRIVLYSNADNDHQFSGLGLNTNMLRYQTGNSTSDHVFFSGIDANSSKELMRISGKGNIGIGTTTPNASLQFGNSLANRKIVLFEATNNDHQFYGFGYNEGTLRYQTTDVNADHVFFRGSSASTSQELMRIKGNGFIGIGTSTPTVRLDVAGQVKITDGSQGAGRVLTSDADGLASWIAPSNINGNEAFEPQIVATLDSTKTEGFDLENTTSAAVATSDLYLNDVTLYLRGKRGNIYMDNYYGLVYNSIINGAFLFGENGGSLGYAPRKPVGKSFNVYGALTWVGNGNVGIGTDNPTTKLEVNGQVKITDGTQGAGKVLTSDATGLASWQSNTSSQWNNSGSNISYSAGTVGIGTAPVSGIQLKVGGSFNVSSADASTIFHVSSGKKLVFIGQEAYAKANASTFTDTDYSLWVGKGIVSENYAIDDVADWSDYVLERNYSLPSLKEVETFITENKHLPNFPSEAELKKKGYNLHTMNNCFMKTIEEMTLHSIAQEKKISEQEKKAQEQETKMNEQTSRLNALATELAEITALLKGMK